MTMMMTTIMTLCRVKAKAEVSGGQTERWQTSTHVALWLESLGLHQYITSFQQCKIDSIAVLLKLTNDDLMDLRVEARHRSHPQRYA